MNIGACGEEFCQRRVSCRGYELADNQAKCRTCGQPYPAAGDGWDGQCPTCADRRER